MVERKIRVGERVVYSLSTKDKTEYTSKVLAINDNIVVVSSKGTPFEDLCETIGLEKKMIKKVLSKFIYVIRWSCDRKGEEIGEKLFENLNEATKWFKEHEKYSDTTMFDMCLMKYNNETFKWVDDIL